MARKKKTAKKGNAIPKGFTPITNQSKSWPNDETAEGDSIVGTVIGYKTVNVTQGNKKVDKDIAKIELEDGSQVDVWESAVLKPLFEEDYTEYRVFIQYDGLGKKKKGQNAPRLYTIAVEDE